jgi:hypothetical protein
MFRWQVGRRGLSRHLPTKHDQLSPAQPRLFFLTSAGQHKRKRCSCPFFGGGFYDLPPHPPQFFLSPRDFSRGTFGVQNAKISGHARKPQKLGLNIWGLNICSGFVTAVAVGKTQRLCSGVRMFTGFCVLPQLLQLVKCLSRARGQNQNGI